MYSERGNEKTRHDEGETHNQHDVCLVIMLQDSRLRPGEPEVEGMADLFSKYFACLNNDIKPSSFDKHDLNIYIYIYTILYRHIKFALACR